MSVFKKITYHPFFIKLFNWEYWSFNVVYAPMYIVWILIGIRIRAIFFFNTANPTIKNGGFLLESKKEIYDIIPSQYYPKTLLFFVNDSAEKITTDILNAQLSYPLIGKPDIGMRGLCVKKLNSITEVLQYAQETKVDFLVQEFIPFENEVGIFYYRLPNQSKGKISGIVGKEFLTVIGNGIDTIYDLLKKDKRFILQLPTLVKDYGSNLQKVLAKGESFLMVPYGNHARGAKFIDVSSLIDDTLTDTIDNICKQVPEFYYGRMDVRYNTWEELCDGKNFSIIELNGAGSEPTHIYDPKHSIWYAWAEIYRHWVVLYKISKLNHEEKKLPYMSIKDGLSMLKENRRYLKLLTV